MLSASAPQVEILSTNSRGRTRRSALRSAVRRRKLQSRSPGNGADRDGQPVEIARDALAFRRYANDGGEVRRASKASRARAV